MVSRLPAPDVKCGNLKDPAKIAEKVAEAEADAIGKMALSPLYGRVCAFVVTDLENHYRHCIAYDSDLDESDLIKSFFDWFYTRNPTLITWNGEGFDLPFVYKRAALLGIRPNIPLSVMTGRYDNPHHIDLMKVWAGFGQFSKLDDVAKAVVEDKKIEIDFRKFPELITTPEGRTKLLDYCEQDTRLTYKLYQRFKGVLFP